VRGRSGAAHPLHALAAARRRRRIGEVDLFDAFYSAYLTGVAVVVLIIVGTTFVPDHEVDAATAARVADVGGAWVGLGCALLTAAGCRSGGRGGPLALEPPVVQHVLLAPVDRAMALRGPAWKQLRFAVAVGAAAGGVTGLLTARRLPGGAAAYVASGALAGALVAGLVVGVALAVSGRRAPMRTANALALAVVAVSVAEVLAGTRATPLTWLGLIALSPLETASLALLAGPVVAVVVWAGVGAVGGTSLEAAERRAGLVGQLRFAVTLQDLRTVVLLRRQLAQEHARTRPWVRLGRSRVAERFPVLWRAAQGIARFPAVRVVRMGVLGAVAGLAMRGVWSGTTPLLVVAGLAVFVAALDAVEPLSQEVDRPDLWASYPRRDGHTLLRHLPTPALAMAVVGVVGVAVAALAGPSLLAVGIGAVVVPGVALAAVAGAAGSVVMGPPDTLLRVQMPEAAGASMVIRAVWPPGLVVLALAPVVAARATTSGSPIAAAAGTEVLVLVPSGIVLAWLSTRKARLR
jgi:hypothetical protein